MKMKLGTLAQACLLVVAATGAVGTMASSHREAPGTAGSPRVDGTDFYMFRSYEGVAANGTGGRSDYVTMIANYQPLQAPYGGPNYFQLDPNALYEIHIDNNGNAVEDITFQFRFKNTLKSTALDIGTAKVAIPLVQSGAVANLNDANLNVNETYEVSVVRGDRRKGTVQAVSKTGGGTTFEKPVDNIGVKTIADYPTYAAKHIHTITIPGCPAGKDQGKVFVGQRQEGFAVNLGPVFDLVGAPASVLLDPNAKDAVGQGGKHVIQKANVTSLAIEVHKDCLTAGTDPVIGGWTTASLRQARLLNGKPGSGNNNAAKQGGAWTQVSRLGNPLVNELVIGLPDKDKFNASAPKDDTQFLTYVSNPTLPALLGLVLAGDAKAVAPTNLPRTDLLTTFLTGITGVNKPTTPTPSEMLRLNTAVAAVPFAGQNRLGVAGNALAGGTDNAGFPNGRRPKDDVVDIALVAMVGGLCAINGSGDALKLNSVPGVPSLTSKCDATALTSLMAQAGSNGLPNAANIHDAVDQATVPFLTTFPYLNTPIPGAIGGGQ
ncbi:MAG: DUF4331 domain-containing protein [Polaromonas sp.]